MKKRILGLDIAKVFASLMVVLMHTLRNLNEAVPFHPYLYYFSRSAIPVFFMSLGYVQLNKISVSKQYVMTKIKNIVRVSLAWILIYDCIILICKHKFLVHRDIWGWLFQKGSFSIFWFMATMIILYLLLPKLLVLFHCKFANIVFVVLCIICALSDLFNFVNIIIFRSNTFWQSYIPQPYRVWTWVLYFYAGGMVRKYQHLVSTKCALFMSILTSICAVEYEYILCYKTTHVINAEFMYDSLPVIVWCISLFALFLCIHTAQNNICNIVTQLASCLIPIYAVHYQILRELKAVEWPILHTSQGELVCYVGVVIVCVVIGLILSNNPRLSFLTKI